MNILGSIVHKEPIADRYLKTPSASVFAFTKFLEMIAAGLGMIVLVFVSDAVSGAVREITEAVCMTFYFVVPEKLAGTLSNLVRYPMLIPVSILVLIILDGLGVLMMRYTGSGEGLVQLIHRIYWLTFLIEIIFLIVGMIRFVLGLDDLSRAMGSNQSMYSTLGAMGAIAWIYFFVTLIFLLFYCNYHHDICVVLETVSAERRSAGPVTVKKNRLAGRSGWFAFGTGCYFVFSAILFFYPLLTETNVISDEKIKEMTNLPYMAVMGINMLISLISFAKYLSLRICVGNFQKMHKK